MPDMRTWHLVMYDIREPARWREVWKLLKGYGRPIQYSVFRVKATRLQVERMRWELERLLAAEDDLLIVPICGRCVTGLQTRNRDDAWPQDEPPYKIVGS